MIRSINKVTNKGDGYVEMKDMGGQEELKKLVLGLKGLMVSIETLKNQVLKGNKVVANTLQFNQQFDRLKGLRGELSAYDPATAKQRQIQQQTMQMVETFIKGLQPEQVEARLAAIKDEIQERSKHSEQASRNIGGAGDKKLMESYKKQLDQDKKELQELEKIMNIVKTIALDSKNMLLNQGTQLRVGAQTIKRALDNVTQAKGQLNQAVEYTADHNRLTLYCCLLVTLIVTIILMIYYASAH